MIEDNESREIPTSQDASHYDGAEKSALAFRGEPSNQSEQQTETKTSDFGNSNSECRAPQVRSKDIDLASVSGLLKESKANALPGKVLADPSGSKPFVQTSVSQYLRIYKGRKEGVFKKHATEEQRSQVRQEEPVQQDMSQSYSAASVQKKPYSKYLAASGDSLMARSLRDSVISVGSIDSKASSELKKSYHSQYLHKHQASLERAGSRQPIDQDYINMFQEKMKKVPADNSSRYLDWSMKKSGDHSHLSSIFGLGLTSPDVSRRPSQVSKQVDSSRAEVSTEIRRDPRQVSFQIGEEMGSPLLSTSQIRDSKSILKNKHSAHVAVSKALQFDQKYTPIAARQPLAKAAASRLCSPDLVQMQAAPRDKPELNLEVQKILSKYNMSMGSRHTHFDAGTATHPSQPASQKYQPSQSSGAAHAFLQSGGRPAPYLAPLVSPVRVSSLNN